MDAARFTLLAALVRVVFRRPPPGERFGLPAPIDRARMFEAALGVAGAVAGGWLVYGPGLLPFGASLVVAYAAGAACEWLAGARGPSGKNQEEGGRNSAPPRLPG